MKGFVTVTHKACDVGNHARADSQVVHTSSPIAVKTCIQELLVGCGLSAGKADRLDVAALADELLLDALAKHR